MQNYLSNRHHISSINGSFSDWNDIIADILEGSILGPFLFNVFFWNFSDHLEMHFRNYTDDCNLYATGKNLHQMRKKQWNRLNDSM